MQKNMEAEFNSLTFEQEQAHLDKIKDMQQQFNLRIDQNDGQHQDEVSAMQQEIENQKRDAAAKIKRLEEEHASEVRSLKEAAREKEIRQREH